MSFRYGWGIVGFRLLGLFHRIADMLKMFTKEDIVPAGVVTAVVLVFFGEAPYWPQQSKLSADPS